MEFDCVGICNAPVENFPEDEFLCRVLYVMMTRPLHRLCIWHRGELSPLLQS
jgi:DNA helicase-2/ATP-dependent DNA helicase PcrA